MVSDYAEIPRQIKEMNQRHMVTLDIMFVIGIAFLVSVLCGLKFTMVEYMPNCTAPELYKYLKKVYNNYLKYSFIVNLFLMDH